MVKKNFKFKNNYERARQQLKKLDDFFHSLRQPPPGLKKLIEQQKREIKKHYEQT